MPDAPNGLLYSYLILPLYIARLECAETSHVVVEDDAQLTRILSRGDATTTYLEPQV